MSDAAVAMYVVAGANGILAGFSPFTRVEGPVAWTPQTRETMSA